MNVTFTSAEYGRLLELVHFGMQVVNDGRDDAPPAAGRYDALVQKLLECATPCGCSDLVTVTAEGRLAPSGKLVDDEQLQTLLGDYQNALFWHELVMRLADRDLAAEQNRRGDEAAADTEVRRTQIEDGYWDEFEQNDLAHVMVLKGGKG